LFDFLFQVLGRTVLF